MEIKCAHNKLVQLEKLIPHPRNDNTHKDEHADLLAKVMKARGIRHPIIVSKKSGFIVAGHLRLLAAQRLGLDEYPVDEQDFENEADEYAFLSSDNNVARYAEFDEEKFVDNIKDLELDQIDFEELGLIDFELPQIEVDGQCDEDEVPEVKNDPVTVRGDVWLLGNHRVMCGDSTMIDDVERLMNGNKADMVFTDPPYGVAYEQGKFTGKQVKNKFAPIKNDEKQGDDLYDFIYSVFTNIHASTVENAPFYVWSPPLAEGYEIHKAIKASGTHIQSQIIWDKTRLILGRADYHWQHEICWYGFKKNKPNHYWCGDRKQTTIWKQKRDSQYNHPTQKPVELAERAIENSTQSRNNSVVDLFLGSGSTLMGCEKLGRKCFGLEMSELYCDTIIQRYQKFTGKEAILESTGKTYNSLLELKEESLPRSC